jgi:hypothetical protein
VKCLVILQNHARDYVTWGYWGNTLCYKSLVGTLLCPVEIFLICRPFLPPHEEHKTSWSLGIPGTILISFKTLPQCVGNKVLTTVVMKSTYPLGYNVVYYVEKQPTFLRTNRHNLQDRISQARCQRESRWQAITMVSCSAYSTLKMEAICSSETSVEFQRSTRSYIPEDSTLHATIYLSNVQQIYYITGRIRRLQVILALERRWREEQKYMFSNIIMAAEFG